MKKISLILFSVFLSGMVICQEIPKKANLITYENDSLADFDLFKVCVNILKSDGYTFEQLDKDFYMCTTKPIHPEKSNFEYKLDITVTGKNIQIRSFVQLMTSYSSNYAGIQQHNKNAWERGANKGLSTSIWRYGWNKQEKFSEKLMEKVPGNLTFVIEESK